MTDADQLAIALDVISTVELARADASYREGMLAAYRHVQRPDLALGLVRAMAGLDAFCPDEPPSINRCTVLPSVRRAPDGILLDLTRPFTDSAGDTWHWIGYGSDGSPLISAIPDSGFYAPIGMIYEESGPFTQGAA